LHLQNIVFVFDSPKSSPKILYLLSEKYSGASIIFVSRGFENFSTNARNTTMEFIAFDSLQSNLENAVFIFNLAQEITKILLFIRKRVPTPPQFLQN
jgi:hypothetical protein